MSDLYVCACEQFYTDHHPECPARRQYDELRDAAQRMVDANPWFGRLKFIKARTDLESALSGRDQSSR